MRDRMPIKNPVGIFIFLALRVFIFGLCGWVVITRRHSQAQEQRYRSGS